MAKPGEYSPEEIAQGLRSGRMKEIGLDDKVDLTQGGEFVIVPKPTHSLSFDYGDGVWQKIPAGAHHRVLDLASELGNSIRQKAFLHRAHHFAIGFEASSALMTLCTGDRHDMLRTMAGFAPHPFEEYTFSMWTSSDTSVIETMIAVHTEEDGESYCEMIALPWGSNDIIQPRQTNRTWTREAVLSDPEAPDDQKAAWMLCDAFRLLLTRRNHVTINAGPGNRTALRKGRRVTFYSKREIKIDLDAIAEIKRSYNDGSGKMMPVYQYRAHLCHSGGRKGCEHEWSRDETRENPYWTCSKCDRRRWHRKAGVRGSAEVGYVRQTYKVVKGND